MFTNIDAFLDQDRSGHVLVAKSCISILVNQSVNTFVAEPSPAFDAIHVVNYYYSLIKHPA